MWKWIEKFIGQDPASNMRRADFAVNDFDADDPGETMEVPDVPDSEFIQPDPTPVVHKSVNERAYELWDAAGRPEGQSDRFWHEAQMEGFK